MQISTNVTTNIHLAESYMQDVGCKCSKVKDELWGASEIC